MELPSSGPSGTVIVQPKFQQVKNETGKKLIVVLEGANLETVKVGGDYELLNSDDHGTYEFIIYR
jgi:hypothetical protein